MINVSIVKLIMKNLRDKSKRKGEKWVFVMK